MSETSKPIPDFGAEFERVQAAEAVRMSATTPIEDLRTELAPIQGDTSGTPLDMYMEPEDVALTESFMSAMKQNGFPGAEEKIMVKSKIGRSTRLPRIKETWPWRGKGYPLGELVFTDPSTEKEYTSDVILTTDGKMRCNRSGSLFTDSYGGWDRQPRKLTVYDGYGALPIDDRIHLRTPNATWGDKKNKDPKPPTQHDALRTLFAKLVGSDIRTLEPAVPTAAPEAPTPAPVTRKIGDTAVMPTVGVSPAEAPTEVMEPVPAAASGPTPTGTTEFLGTIPALRPLAAPSPEVSPPAPTIRTEALTPARKAELLKLQSTLLGVVELKLK